MTPWAVVLVSSGISLVSYLLVQMLLALLVVKRSVPESASVPVLGVCAALSVFIGGFYATKKLPLGTMSSSLIVLGIFLAFLVMLGVLCCKGLVWSPNAAVLLIASVVG